MLKVRRVYNESKGRYGSPRVYQALRREGEVVGENRVARLMQEWGMKARVMLDFPYFGINGVRVIDLDALEMEPNST